MLQTVKFHDLAYTQQDDLEVTTPLILRRKTLPENNQVIELVCSIHTATIVYVSCEVNA